MTRISSSNIIASKRRFLSLTPASIVLAALAAALAGCAQVPVYQQQYVSKPGMVFSDSLVDAPPVNLLSQIEPGAAVSGGAQAAGCTACR